MASFGPRRLLKVRQGGHMNFGSQLYQGVFDIVEGSKPAKFKPY